MQKLNAETLGRLSVEEFKTSSKMPIVVVLDNVRSLHNVGSVFRTADGFAVSSVYLCGITACPPHREIEKTALGATQSMIWHYFKDTTEAIAQLKQDGYEVYALEQTTKSIHLQLFTPKKGQKYALIFGNEVTGVSQEALELCNEAIEIPQFGTKHSFNVSISAGIVLWDFYAKLNEK